MRYIQVAIVQDEEQQHAGCVGGCYGGTPLLEVGMHISFRTTSTIYTFLHMIKNTELYSGRIYQYNMWKL